MTEEEITTEGEINDDKQYLNEIEIENENEIEDEIIANKMAEEQEVMVKTCAVKLVFFNGGVNLRFFSSDLV